MRLSSETLNLTPSFSATVCASVIMFAASSRVSGKRQMSTSVAWVSALIGLKLRLPHSLSQISVRMSVDHWRLEAGADQGLRQGLDARRLRAVEFAQREAVALDDLDHARRHQFGGRVDHAADDALDFDVGGDAAVRIDD